MKNHVPIKLLERLREWELQSPSAALGNHEVPLAVLKWAHHRTSPGARYKPHSCLSTSLPMASRGMAMKAESLLPWKSHTSVFHWLHLTNTLWAKESGKRRFWASSSVIQGISSGEQGSCWVAINTMRYSSHWFVKCLMMRMIHFFRSKRQNFVQWGWYHHCLVSPQRKS